MSKHLTQLQNLLADNTMQNKASCAALDYAIRILTRVETAKPIYYIVQGDLGWIPAPAVGMTRNAYTFGPEAMPLYESLLATEAKDTPPAPDTKDSIIEAMLRELSTLTTQRDNAALSAGMLQRALNTTITERDEARELVEQWRTDCQVWADMVKTRDKEIGGLVKERDEAHKRAKQYCEERDLFKVSQQKDGEKIFDLITENNTLRADVAFLRFGCGIVPTKEVPETPPENANTHEMTQIDGLVYRVVGNVLTVRNYGDYIKVVWHNGMRYELAPGDSLASGF